MEYKKMLINDLRNELDDGKVTSEELFNEANTLAHSYQEEINPFVTIIDKYKCRGREKTILTGLFYNSHKTIEDFKEVELVSKYMSTLDS